MTATGQNTKPREPEEESWGSLGPAMRGLNERHRAFVHYLVMDPSHGGLTRAYRKAGYGQNSRPGASRHNLTQSAFKLRHDPRIVAAIAEESRKVLRAGHPEAVAALFQVIRNVDHKDRVRAISAILDRCDPLESKYQIDVVHRHIDPDREALEELKALRRLAVSRDKLLEVFGPNGLDRIEALEAVENAQRAAAARTVDGKVIEHSEASND